MPINLFNIVYKTKTDTFIYLNCYFYFLPYSRPQFYFKILYLNKG